MHSIKTDCFGCVEISLCLPLLALITLKFMWHSFVDHIIKSCTVLNFCFMFYFVVNLHVYFHIDFKMSCAKTPPYYTCQNLQKKERIYRFLCEMIWYFNVPPTSWVVTFFVCFISHPFTFMIVFFSLFISWYSKTSKITPFFRCFITAYIIISGVLKVLQEQIKKCTQISLIALTFLNVLKQIPAAKFAIITF